MVRIDKREGVLLAAAFVLLILLGGSASASDLQNTAHDFSRNAAGTVEACDFCHAGPESGVSALASADVSVDTAAWTATRESNPASCLGCHDGSVASDTMAHAAVGGTVATTKGFDWNASLGNGHPVFVVYDSALARRSHKLFDPATTPSGLGGTIAEDLLDGSQVVCSSCHGVHDRSGRGDFLRVTNEGSRLCLTCHDV